MIQHRVSQQLTIVIPTGCFYSLERKSLLTDRITKISTFSTWTSETDTRFIKEISAKKSGTAIKSDLPDEVSMKQVLVNFKPAG